MHTHGMLWLIMQRLFCDVVYAFPELQPSNIYWITMFIEQDWPCMSYELYVTAHITRTTIHFCPHIIS